MCFIRINPISIDLYSKNEKKSLTKLLTAELSAVQHPFKFIALSQPIDISILIGELTNLMNKAESVQKKLLKQELAVMNTYTNSGEVVQRQFYLSIWDKYYEDCEKAMLARTKELCSMFENGGISCDIVKKEEVIRLIGLINNPAYAHLEDGGYGDCVPVVDGV